MNTGIYCITNRRNGKVYVGSAVDVWKRRNQHLCLLRNGSHPNKHLQAAYAQGDEDDFVFSVLELVGKRSLRKREQFWIDQKKAADRVHVYNKAPYADRPRGYRWTDAMRRAQSKRRKNKPWTEARRAAHQPTRGPMPRSAVQKSRAAKLLRYVVFSPTGRRYVVTDLKPFCTKYGLRYENMISVSNGWLRSYKEWRCHKLLDGESDKQAVARTMKLARKRAIVSRKRHQRYYQDHIEACRASCRRYSKRRKRGKHRASEEETEN